MRQLGIIAGALALLVACGSGGEGAAVQSFVAFGSSTASITLAWQPTAGATGYTVERAGGDGSFAPIASFDGTAQAYLDTGLTAGTYRYRLAALGTADLPREAEATTSADESIRTVDDPAIGDPVTQTVGSAGGTVERTDGTVRVIVPAGALPDGTAVVVQAITSPLDPLDPAFEITADGRFALPVTVSLGLSDEEAADPSNLAIAVKQPDGTWVRVPAILGSDGRALSVTLPADPEEVPGKALPPPGPRGKKKVLKLRALMVSPGHTFVKMGTKTIVKAYLRFSDEPCAEEGHAGWFCQIALYNVNIPEPVVDDRPIKNSDGVWTNGGKGNIFVTSSETNIIHSAPSAKPSPEVWGVTFTMNKEPRRSAMAIFAWSECLAQDQKLPADVCLPPTWKGTASETARLTDLTGGFLNRDVQADVTWKPMQGDPLGTIWEATGTATYSATGRQGNCTITLPSTTVEIAGVLQFVPGSYFASGSGAPSAMICYHYDCPAGGSFDSCGPPMPWLGTGIQSFAPDDRTIAGTSAGGGITYTWSFARMP